MRPPVFAAAHVHHVVQSLLQRMRMPPAEFLSPYALMVHLVVLQFKCKHCNIRGSPSAVMSESAAESMCTHCSDLMYINVHSNFRYTHCSDLMYIHVHSNLRSTHRSDLRYIHVHSNLRCTHRSDLRYIHVQSMCTYCSGMRYS